MKMTGTLIIMERLQMGERGLIMIIVLSQNVVLSAGVHGSTILGAAVAPTAAALTPPGATTASVSVWSVCSPGHNYTFALLPFCPLPFTLFTLLVTFALYSLRRKSDPAVRRGDF